MTSIVWRPGDESPPVTSEPGLPIFRPDILDAIEKCLQSLDSDLRRLSLDIHSHPELGFAEYHAHNALVQFMEREGFNVTKNYLLETAWIAKYTYGTGGRTIGVNSEMDALKGIGHACGHNLIAIAGVAVACAIKQALETFKIPGSVYLLGTPAEEGGSGKVKLFELGGYEGMDICLMCHPAPGPKGSVSLSSCLALQRLEVEYFGQTAHAALSPWEGRNALDAAVLGYNNISALRQQLLPTSRVHGIFEGKDWMPNIIPDYAKFHCYVRAPTKAQRDATVKRVLPCFEAAALATGCQVKIHASAQTHDLRQNTILGGELANIVCSRYGGIDYEWGIKSASTDFGNITYEIPSIHPGFAIPTDEDGGNHTPAFAKSAATLAAHRACLDICKALSAVGIRDLLDDEFHSKVVEDFRTIPEMS